MTRVTNDSISLRGAGVVSILQPAQGHRFTLDSILLADFCRLRPRDRVLELGAGTGVISLLLAKKHPAATVTAVELQKESADLLRRNARENGLEDRITILEKNIRNIADSRNVFDAVIANPPYAEAGSGKKSPLASRRIARQADDGDIAGWLAKGSLLRNRGRFFLIFAAARTAELLSLLRERGLEPKRLRFVHSAADRPASLVLVESVRSAARGVRILPPLVLNDSVGKPSAELRRIYTPCC